jgi:hypothetical protein
MQIAGCLMKSRKNVHPCKIINIFDGQGVSIQDFAVME